MILQNVPSQHRTTFIVGAGACAVGLYFGLVGFGILSTPSRINGLLWLGALAGLAISCAGLSIVVRALAGADGQTGDMPSDAPRWMKAVYWLCLVTAMASLASIGTWIAFGSGERAFNLSGLIHGPVGAGVGRAIFGIGALMAWAMVFAMARAGAKKTFGAN